MPELHVIFARKINKIPVFYDICPKKINRMPEFYMISCPKTFFPIFWGGGQVPLPSVFYAYDNNVGFDTAT